MTSTLAPTYVFGAVLAVAALARWLRHPVVRLPIVQEAERRVSIARWIASSHLWRLRPQDATGPLPGLLDEIAGALRAGASLPMALADASGGPTPAHAAVRDVLARAARGAVLADALEVWCGHASDPDSRLAANSLVLVARLGVPDPRGLETAAQVLRERATLRGEVRAQAAQARASAGFLTAAPPLFLAGLVVADRHVATVVGTTRLGWSCLLAGVILDTVGAVWMARIMHRASP
jgi:tight adherence protein B